MKKKTADANLKITNFVDLSRYMGNYITGQCYIMRHSCEKTFNGEKLTYVVKNGLEYKFDFTIQKSTRGKICYFYEDMFYFNEHELVYEIYKSLKKTGKFNKRVWRY